MDAEFARDQDNCKSIMGRVIYLNDVPIGWNSKAMSGVTLSSVEAEYVYMSEGVKDLKLIFMCLKYLKLKVNLRTTCLTSVQRTYQASYLRSTRIN